MYSQKAEQCMKEGRKKLKGRFTFIKQGASFRIWAPANNNEPRKHWSVSSRRPRTTSWPRTGMRPSKCTWSVWSVTGSARADNPLSTTLRLLT